MVYIKPDKGRYGQGVMKAETLPWAGFRLYYGLSAQEYTLYKDLLVEVERIMAGQGYIVQQGIQLLTHDSCLFDARIMVQQSPKRKWEVTGFLARVAAPHQIVTNFHSGGTPHELVPILAQYLPPSETALYLARLRRLGERVAVRLRKSFPNLKEVGLDVAIDRDMRPWILEVNTRPQADVFLKLGDLAMYHKIVSYAKRYGKYGPRDKPKALVQGHR